MIFLSLIILLRILLIFGFFIFIKFLNFMFLVNIYLLDFSIIELSISPELSLSLFESLSSMLRRSFTSLFSLKVLGETFSFPGVGSLS